MDIKKNVIDTQTFGIKSIFWDCLELSVTVEVIYENVYLLHLIIFIDIIICVNQLELRNKRNTIIYY